MKKLCLVLVVFFSLCCTNLVYSQETTQTKQNKEPSIITIENALKTTSLKNEDTKTDIIRFEGEVVVSVEKGDSKTSIKADFVDFNREYNSLYAEGNVRMEQSSGGTVSETITADSVLFNTSTLEGFFNQGRVVQENQEAVKLDDDTTLIVSADIFAKGGENAVSFKNGSLTFCDDPNPHWKINASRIWLLPGNEFAFLNALLFVGPVPVMYFPFFYYPKDELVFNPAFGFQAREGFFIQTTTYLLGRKPLNTGSDDDDKNAVGFNFMQQSELKEQRLEGLVLRNLDEKAEMPTDYLKIMADYYTTLGGMIGIEGYFEPNQYVKNIFFDTRLGFSNVVFPVEDFPLYINKQNDKRYTDYGWFFGLKTPFRFGFNFETDMKFDDFSLSIDIPFYSDPWFDSDFTDRNESMDWIDFFLSGALTTPLTEEQDEVNSGMSGFTWDITSSYRPSFEVLKPWVTNFSIDKLNTSLVFSTQNTPKSDFNNEDIVYTNSPNRKFFFPSQIKPLNIELSIGGTLFDWSSSDLTKTKSSSNNFDITNEQRDILSGLETPEELQVANDENVTDNDSDTSTAILDNSTLPEVDIPNVIIEKDAINTYNLKYNIDPDFAMYYNYSSTKPNSNDAISPDDFLLGDPKSAYYVFKMPINLTSSLNMYSSLFSMTNTLSFSPLLKEHFMLSSDYYTDSQKDSQKISDYKERNLDIKNTNTVAIKPLILFEPFKNSSISWNSSINFLDTEFVGTADDPLWEYNGPKWEPESITSHNLNTVFEAKQEYFYQRFTFKSNLPPQVELFSGTLDLGFPFVTVNLGTGYKRESKDSQNWLFQPLTLNSTWSFFEKTKEGRDNPYKLTLKQNYTFDIEDNHHDYFSLSVLWNNFNLTYSMKQSYSYSLDINTGWIPSKTESFLPSNLSLRWNFDDYTYENKKQTISLTPGFSTELNWDFIIPTKSYFTFAPSLSFEIKDSLTLKFSAVTRNDQLIRYMQNIIGFEHTIPGETNIFVDLWHSFCFWDESKRISSGFKIESFNFELAYDLHDWVLASEFQIKPRIITNTNGTKYYDYSPYFTLSVEWKPMPSIKTTIEDEYGEFTLNPQK